MRCVEIGAAFEAMAGVGVQAVAAGGATNGHGLEPCGFDQHILRAGRNHRVPAAHDAGKSEGFGVIGDDEVFWIERSFYSVEGLEFFALASVANHDAALDFVEVESM